MTEVTTHQELSLNLVELKLFFVQDVMWDSVLYKGSCGTAPCKKSHGILFCPRCHVVLCPIQRVVWNFDPCTETC
jgi:hypothetical protein